MDIDRLKQKLFKRVPQLVEFFRRNYDIRVTEDEMRAALTRLVENQVEEFFENSQAVLFDPRFPEHQKLRNYLPKASIFTGFQEFSLQKLGAMVLFLAAATGARLSKTRLNKLAFYSDFRHFSRSGRSISGCAYRHLPHGPVVDDYEALLKQLSDRGVIRVKDEMTNYGKASFVEILDDKWISNLTESEKESLSQIVSEFGDLNAAEISDKSHEEMAYKNTRMGELIAYGYSQFLND